MLAKGDSAGGGTGAGSHQKDRSVRRRVQILTLA